MTNHQRAQLSLLGLSIGDAAGERLFAITPTARAARVIDRPAPWRWTDDTAMAVSVVETLAVSGGISPDELAVRFARRYIRDPARGYGAGAHQILSAIASGVPWRDAAGAAFDGQGSAGNGAAMRVAPVGAYFAGDLAAAAEHATRSSAPTHAHAEGVDGAVAIAVLAAQVFAGERSPATLLGGVLAHVRPGDVRRGLAWVADHLDADAATVAATVGNGAHVRAADTVPFAVWCTLRHLDDFAGAVWTCGDVGGDIDTTAAMCGGVIVGAVGEAGLPADWRAKLEPLP